MWLAIFHSHFRHAWLHFNQTSLMITIIQVLNQEGLMASITIGILKRHIEGKDPSASITHSGILTIIILNIKVYQTIHPTLGPNHGVFMILIWRIIMLVDICWYSFNI